MIQLLFKQGGMGFLPVDAMDNTGSKPKPPNKRLNFRVPGAMIEHPESQDFGQFSSPLPNCCQSGYEI
jgi:hypothetical protein